MFPVVFLNIIFTTHTRQCVSVDNIFYERAKCSGIAIRQGRLLYFRVFYDHHNNNDNNNKNTNGR